MKPPSKFLLMLEVFRSIVEYAQGIFLTIPLQHISPKGDGHPVVIIPGLGTTDGSTQYIRNFLATLGYNVYPWGFGRNMGPRHGLDKLMKDIEQRVRDISNENGGVKVSVIGWSLGGIYARELAKNAPDIIRQVITLGTPFKANPNSTNAARLYELLSKDKSYTDTHVMESISIRPTVPFTSIYSKTDGVVAWKSSIEDETEISENIEVPMASHLGLGHNPITMYIIANRLSQPETCWSHYKK